MTVASARGSIAWQAYLVGDCHEFFQFVETLVDSIAPFLLHACLSELKAKVSAPVKLNHQATLTFRDVCPGSSE